MKKDNFIKQAARWVARNIITPPTYSDITAIGPDCYHCDGPNGSVILSLEPLPQSRHQPLGKNGDQRWKIIVHQPGFDNTTFVK